MTSIFLPLLFILTTAVPQPKFVPPVMVVDLTTPSHMMVAQCTTKAYPVMWRHVYEPEHGIVPAMHRWENVFPGDRIVNIYGSRSVYECFPTGITPTKGAK